MKPLKIFTTALIAAFLSFLTLSSASAASEINLNPNWRGKNKYEQAVDGYDVVAYFTEGAPVKGSADYSTEYKGADWYFSSQENLDKFKAEPIKYAPQYGGYCAWAASQGNLANGDPERWAIHEGKLYLNYSKGVQKKWLKDKPGFIAKADANWPGLLDK